MRTIYECSLSRTVKWGTVAGLAIIIGAIIVEVWYLSSGRDDRYVGLFAIVVLIVALLSCFLLYPQYIVSTDEGIGIHSLLRTIRIPYSDIERIVRAPENILGNTNTIRLFGIGGVLGYVGFFRTKGIGNYRAFVTDRKKVFIVYRKKGMPVAFSVSEPDEFMPYYLKGSSSPSIVEPVKDAAL
ncbi:MAG: hypothetical protein IJ776_00150 [Paludibacteraceae bacterium]|nr:hypothetical protein [Paludibacteraceae bacterium]